MNRHANALTAGVLAAGILAAACGNAQDGTVVRVDYVTVVVDADGTETPWAEGVHYIADDGRHRHDETVFGRSPTSSYRLPDEDVNVTVNHSLLEAVRSGQVAPMEVAAPVGRGFQAAFFEDLEEPLNLRMPPSIGDRTIGPLQLRGYVQETLGEAGRAEYWVYEHPRMRTDPLAYPPIPIELAFSMSAGQTLETRATSAQRVPLEPDTFVVPDPASEATPGD